MTLPEFISIALSAQRYNVTVRTIENWMKTRGMRFPKPVFLRGVRHFRVTELEAWEERFGGPEYIKTARATA